MLAADFRSVFGREPEALWAAPGRINLIGEHTDYNDGFALPFALPHLLTVAAAPTGDDTLTIRSRQADGTLDTTAPELAPGTVRGWAAYPAGVVWDLVRAGHPVGGMEILVDSAVPLGAGLSSSAALTCAVTRATSDLYGLDLDPHATARTAQRAENDFVGMPCGIMDQLAVLLGIDQHALLVDARSLETTPVPLAPGEDDTEFLVIDTRAPHRLVTDEYAERRWTCEWAAVLLGVPALRDVDPTDLPGALAALPENRLRRRVRHVVTENARVLETVHLLRQGRTRAIGPLLTASHVSLRDDFEVSVPEVDTAVDALLTAGALGARITGGGFGGCVISLVESGTAPRCTAAVRDAFARRAFTPPTSFTPTPSPGARSLRE
ncbi:galactokinase [Spiractinospora alimapuensis]|nr:galactokinase [Spiractinospora alimapuensis]